MTIPAFGLGTFRLKDDVVIASVKTALGRKRTVSISPHT